MLTPKEGELLIGRGYNMDLIIPDPTLSRMHCSISYRDGKFELKDQGSKFGSLILLRGAIEVEKVMCLQVGSKLYRLQSQPVRSH